MSTRPFWPYCYFDDVEFKIATTEDEEIKNEKREGEKRKKKQTGKTNQQKSIQITFIENYLVRLYI